MKKYFYPGVSPYTNKIHIYMTNDFYERVGSLRVSGKEGQFASYNFVFFKLYDLLPSDFYKYVSGIFGAVIFLRSDFVNFAFTNLKSAEKFCEDANRRFSYQESIA